jgi:hypothetical protein
MSTKFAETPKGQGRRLRLSSAFAGLLSLGLLATAQNDSIAYQSLPDDQLDALALNVPADDPGRYKALRDEFTMLHCPPDALREQPTGKRDASNLICTLPGKDAGLIVVVSRYEHKKGAAANGRWGEAILVPLLYNALRAQSRVHTFVFAALNGEAGEQAFFEDLHKNGSGPINALVVLEDLGRSIPYVYTPRPDGLSKKSHELTTAMALLESEAISTASFQRFPSPRIPARWTGMFSNSILTREYDTPSILIFSSVQTKIVSPTGQNDMRTPFLGPEPVTGPYFRQAFNFVAYFLCRIDIKFPI